MKPSFPFKIRHIPQKGAFFPTCQGYFMWGYMACPYAGKMSLECADGRRTQKSKKKLFHNEAASQLFIPAKNIKKETLRERKKVVSISFCFGQEMRKSKVSPNFRKCFAFFSFSLKGFIFIPLTCSSSSVSTSRTICLRRGQSELFATFR